MVILYQTLARKQRHWIIHTLLLVLYYIIINLTATQKVWVFISYFTDKENELPVTK